MLFSNKNLQLGYHFGQKTELRSLMCWCTILWGDDGINSGYRLFCNLVCLFYFQLFVSWLRPLIFTTIIVRSSILICSMNISFVLPNCIFYPIRRPYYIPHASRSLLCIRFVVVAFQSEEEVRWRRGPPWPFLPALDPPLDKSGRKTTTLHL